MQSTPIPNEADPHDAFAIDPDVVLAARADSTSARPVPEVRPSALQSAAKADPSAGASAPSVDATFRATVCNTEVPGGRVGIGKWARQALMGFLFALCSGIAAAGWTQYGDSISANAGSWTPKFLFSSSQVQETPDSAEQSSPPAIQAAAADQAAAQAAPPPPTPGIAAPGAAVASLPPETAQLLQSMSQQIEQLKASIEQIKTGQEQMSRDIARNSATRIALAKPPDQKTPDQNKPAEPNLRPRMPAPPQHPAAAMPIRKPRPAFAPVQAAAPAMSPRTIAVAPMPLPPAAAPPPLPPPPQAAADPDFDPVVRPPMPVR